MIWALIQSLKNDQQNQQFPINLGTLLFMYYPPTMLGNYGNRFQALYCRGTCSSMINQHPSVSKSNQLHDAILHLFEV